ncbi:MAG: galactokinase [Actinomycetaceae bacterium]|nr:galactokinase [Actinomycetaceae bacterium]
MGVIVNKAWSSTEGAARVTELFERTFGSRPQAIFSAPGRVNVIGEHTDYNGGFALPMALPHRTYAAVTRREDRLVRLISAQESGVREISLDDVDTHDSPHPVEGWPAYVVGVAWALEQEGLGPLPGLDVAIDSCVPFGAGLSSSAALECAVAAAWDAFVPMGADGERLLDSDEGRARLVTACVRAENEIAGAPTGGMDQAASLRCVEGHVILLDCRDQSVTQIPFDVDSVNMELLVIDTRAPHALADGQYASRRNACESAAQKLDVELLVEVDRSADLLGLTEEETKRVRHVTSEIDRTLAFVRVLERGDLGEEALRELGQLMDESHESLRVDYEVTCPELDTAVNVARANGAYGARMTGGGFGGSAIALVPATAVDEVTAAIAQAFADQGFNEPNFLRASPSKPAF